MFRLARPRFRLRLVASACEAQSTRPERTRTERVAYRADHARNAQAKRERVGGRARRSNLLQSRRFVVALRAFAQRRWEHLAAMPRARRVQESVGIPAARCCIRGR